jgi:hypothetical protein
MNRGERARRGGTTGAEVVRGRAKSVRAGTKPREQCTGRGKFARPRRCARQRDVARVREASCPQAPNLSTDPTNGGGSHLPARRAWSHALCIHRADLLGALRRRGSARGARHGTARNRTTTTACSLPMAAAGAAAGGAPVRTAQLGLRPRPPRRRSPRRDGRCRARARGRKRGVRGSARRARGRVPAAPRRPANHLRTDRRRGRTGTTRPRRRPDRRAGTRTPRLSGRARRRISRSLPALGCAPGGVPGPANAARRSAGAAAALGRTAGTGSTGPGQPRAGAAIVYRISAAR